MPDWKNLSKLEISKWALATAAQKDALKQAGLPFDELTTKAQVSALFSAGKTGPSDPAAAVIRRSPRGRAGDTRE